MRGSNHSFAARRCACDNASSGLSGSSMTMMSARHPVKTPPTEVATREPWSTARRGQTPPKITQQTGGELTPKPSMFTLGIDHPVQMCSCVFDVIVFVLPCSTFRGNHSTTMHVLKITIGELIMAFRILAVLVIYSQIPSPIFS